MAKHTCTCEDEYFRNTCSHECDLCLFGYSDDECWSVHAVWYKPTSEGDSDARTNER